MLLTYSTRLDALTCGSCQIPFALPANLLAELQATGDLFYCPNGHHIGYSDTEVDRQRQRAERAERELRWAEARESAQRREREAAERSVRAYKGHLTRMRNRIANGVCPVQGCRRNFANVKAHITSQHPEWAQDHAEALA